MTSDPTPSPTDSKTAEFDAFAADYSGGMDNSVKALLGNSGDDFLQVKLDWLQRHVLRSKPPTTDFRILDYGCGRGDLLSLMARRGIKAHFTGSDISGAMLSEGRRIWPTDHGPAPSFLQQAGALVPCESASIDLVLISSVLHHVPVDERPSVYREIQRALKPGGHVVVFEHNPFNPVTRYVVSHTPIDEHAILLAPGEVDEGLRGAGFAQMTTSYIMFAPPRLRSLGVLLDRLLHWLPLGAQYAVSGVKRG